MIRRSIRIAPIALLAFGAGSSTLLTSVPARAEGTANACVPADAEAIDGQRPARAMRSPRATRSDGASPSAMPTPSPWSRRFAPTAAPSAQPPARPMAPLAQVVFIEVHDSTVNRPRQIEKFTLPLTERGGSKVESSVGTVEYRVSVHREGSGLDAPLGFDVRRFQQGPGTGVSEAKVNASVRMKPHQRVVVARIVRSDGSRTEVVATLK